MVPIRGKVLWGLYVVAILAFAGCEDVPKSQQKERPAPSDYISRGIITATASRYLDNSSSEPFEQFEITAMFPQYILREQYMVESLLGTHVPQSDLNVDTCARPEPVLRSRHRRVLSENIEIKLMDVGDIKVQFQGKHIPIPTRTFPDLLKIIDGVIYTADGRRKLDFVPDEKYGVRAGGTDDVAPFDVVLDAPNDLGDVRLNGISPLEQPPVISVGKPVTLTWEGEGYGDEVIATFSWTNVGLTWSVTCRMKDDGLFVVPVDITSEMTSDISETGHEISMSRVRQVSFRSKGLTYGDFSFVASTNFLIRFDAEN